MYFSSLSSQTVIFLNAVCCIVTCLLYRHSTVLPLHTLRHVLEWDAWRNASHPWANWLQVTHLKHIETQGENSAHTNGSSCECFCQKFTKGNFIPCSISVKFNLTKKKRKKRVPFYNYYYCSLCEALIYYPMYDVQIYDSVISVHKSSEYLYVLWLWM